MLDKIKKDINERMSKYTDSRHPTDDEVSIAWLVSEIEKLNPPKTIYDRATISPKYLGRIPGSTRVLIDS